MKQLTEPILKNHCSANPKDKPQGQPSVLLNPTHRRSKSPIWCVPVLSTCERSFKQCSCQQALRLLIPKQVVVAKEVSNCKFEMQTTQMPYLNRVMHFFYNNIGLLLRHSFDGIGNRLGACLCLKIRPECLRRAFRGGVVCRSLTVNANVHGHVQFVAGTHQLFGT